MKLKARYPGTCLICSKEFEVAKSAIVSDPNLSAKAGKPVWVHQECSSEVPSTIRDDSTTFNNFDSNRTANCFSCSTEVDNSCEKCDKCHWFVCPKCGSCGCKFDYGY